MSQKVRGAMRHVRTMKNQCLDDGGSAVHVWTCSDTSLPQEWKFDPVHGTIHNETDYCLRANPQFGAVSVVKCRPGDQFQQWKATLPKDLPSAGKAPVTQAPATEAPTAQALTAQAPVTQAPDIAAPVTKAPTTAVPVTGAPQPVVETDEGDDEGGSEGVTAPIKHRLGYCLDHGGQEVHLWNCTEGSKNQLWTYDPAKGTIKTAKDKCLDASTKTFKKSCKPAGVSQTWSLDATSGQIKSHSGQCLHAISPDAAGSIVALKGCDENDSKGHWFLGPLEAARPSSPLSGVNYIFASLGALLLLVIVFLVLYVAHRRKPSPAAPSPAAPEPSPAAPVPQPKLDAVMFVDPRAVDSAPREIAIVAFGNGPCPEPCDDLCQSGFLGNCYDLGDKGLDLEAMGTQMKCSSAEAAFKGLESQDYAGFGNQWTAMFSVLQSKFKAGTELATALEATGDSFLLCHSSSKGSPDGCTWSDDSDGEGANWLGMQLMLLRERRTGWKRWTSLIEQSMDTRSGERRVPEDCTVKFAVLWQDVVRQATAAVVDKLAVQSEQQDSEAPLLAVSAQEGAA